MVGKGNAMQGNGIDDCMVCGLPRKECMGTANHGAAQDNSRVYSNEGGAQGDTYAACGLSVYKDE